MRPWQVSSSPGQTIFTNRAESLRTCPRRSQAVSNCPTNAIASIPGENIPGNPSECAYGSSRWSRLGIFEAGNLVTLASFALGFLRSLRATLAAGFGAERWWWASFFAVFRLLMDLPLRVLGRHPHHPELAGTVDDFAGIVAALVL